MYHIRRIGIDSLHDHNFSIDRPKGYDCYLLLYLKTRAIFTINGHDTVTEPGTFMLFNINSPHKYRACEEAYINDWIHIETKQPIAIPMDTPIFVGDSIDISGYTKLICDAYFRQHDLACSLLMTALLTEIAAFTNNAAFHSLHFAKLLELRKKIYATPAYNWTINEMAKTVNVSPAHLQEIYKNAFGVACGSDVISSRIESAKLMLADTIMPIAEIAEYSGYNSIVHFSRQFKQMTGLTATEYRAKYNPTIC